MAQFPAHMKFGVATAAYQIEGAWNEDGKGENIWDHALHQAPHLVEDGSNGDVANDSYHRYRDDVQLVKAMGLHFYRFSIAWTRILPKGDLGVVNQKGIEYYSRLIDEIIRNGIEPIVTIYHWDLPQCLQDLGGWTNRETATYFKEYADLLFKTFGDKVKWWITINDPGMVCAGYAGPDLAPHVNSPGVGEYMCGHTVLLAHSLVYQLYNEKYRASQRGQVGITFGSNWILPKTDSPADVAAAERELQFSLGWFANTIFSEEGDYPAVMKERVSANSKAEGLERSRLPAFSPQEVALLRGSADFLGLNHYTTDYATEGREGPIPSRQRDAETVKSQDPQWAPSGSCWLKVFPEGFRKILKWIHERYNAPKILITENGFSDRHGRLDDDDRVAYLKSYLTQLLKSITEDGVNIVGYTCWSLMDNFEWQYGYTEKFGLCHVDYQSPDLTRTPKKSSKFLAEVARTRRVPENFS